MKFFHISDLHIGLRLLDHDLSGDQRYVLGQIADHAKAEQPDAIVIAGDIYNKAAPSPEAVALFDWFLDELVAAVPEAAIMAIAGNHDDALRVDMYNDILEKQSIYLVGTPPKTPGDHIKKVVLCDEYGDVVFWLLPFLTPARVRGALFDADGSTGAEGGVESGAECETEGKSKGETESGSDPAEGRSFKPHMTYDDAIRGLLSREDMDLARRNIIVSHQFYVAADIDPDDVEHMDSENLRVGGLGAVRADVLEGFDYAALGHLHKPMRVGSDTVRFCGTPMQYSVSEAGQAKGIVVVEMADKGHVSSRVIPLKPLHDIRKIDGSFDEVLSKASDDYVSIVVEGAQDIPALEVRDRIRAAFPNLLSYTRRTSESTVADIEDEDRIDASTPYDMCLRFLGDATDAQKDMLRKAVDEAIGVADASD